MEIRCYRKILCISNKDYVVNEEVCVKSQKAVGPHENLLTIVKRHKLQWYGHVSRSSGLAKIITSFKYLGSVITDEGSQAWDPLQDYTDNSSTDEVETSLDWQEHFSQFQNRADALSSHSHLLYACESWTLTAQLQRRIWAMKMKCYHKILSISYKNHVTNEEVCVKIQQAIRPHKDLLIIIKRQNLKWYGHVSCSLGLSRTILLGTVKGERRQDKQEMERQHQGVHRCGVVQVPALGQWRTEENEGNWLRSHLLCPNDPCCQGIGDPIKLKLCMIVK